MKSKNNSFSFKNFSKVDFERFISNRDGEVKLGQNVSVEINDQTRYVVIGINEDIGPQINYGIKGSLTGFESFLKKFLNVQSNEFLKGDNIAVVGFIFQEIDFQEVFDNKDFVQELDDFAYQIIKPFIDKGLIPIVIGGGHNNAYPLIKSLYSKNKEKVNVVNMDPHADYREISHRHSGNAFSTAHFDGYLDKYYVLGLHQSYNNQYILDMLRRDEHHFTFYDDYLLDPNLFLEDINYVRESLLGKEFGLELDMDSIEYFPSSAATPSGITLFQARQYVSMFAQSSNVKYLHLAEAAPQTETEKNYCGKAISYLVTDFIKRNLESL